MKESVLWLLSRITLSHHKYNIFKSYKKREIKRYFTNEVIEQSSSWIKLHESLTINFSKQIQGGRASISFTLKLFVTFIIVAVMFLKYNTLLFIFY